MLLSKSLNASLKSYLYYRYARIEAIQQSPYELQNKIFTQLISKGRNTLFGNQFDFKSIKTAKDFKEKCPLFSYNQIKPFIYKAMDGVPNVLWPGRTHFFSKSSGTTEEQSKFLPVTKDLLNQNLRSGGWDAVANLYHHRPDSSIPAHKNLLMGGSLERWKNNADTFVGDVSAIMVSHLPKFTKRWYAPSFDIALMQNFEEKIWLMANALIKEDLFILAGVPTWTAVLFEQILAITGKSNMHEIWPNANCYFHGGVGFKPYEKQFQEYFPNPEMDYFEVYNASEGYIGFQDRLKEKDMLLLFGNGIYYEFIPSEYCDDEKPEVLSLRDIETDKNYELVISTVAGLWRYRLGDTIKFTSKDPYRFQITGRTKQFINVFGEEVMISDTEKAIAEVCFKLNAGVRDYTVAPIYMNKTTKGGHEWIIEFSKEPQDILEFQNMLDLSLQEINSDYQAKRYKNMALTNLTIQKVPDGSFDNWLKAKGKLGGQSKIPRLSQERKYIEEIKAMLDFRL